LPGRCLSTLGGGEALLYRYLLIVRFVLVNIIAVGLLAGTYLQGWLDAVISAHLVELSVVIFLVFLYGLVLCGAKIWRHGIELNDINAGAPEPESRAGRYLSQTGGAGPESRSILVGNPQQVSAPDQGVYCPVEYRINPRDPTVSHYASSCFSSLSLRRCLRNEMMPIARNIRAPTSSFLVD